MKLEILSDVEAVAAQAATHVASAAQTAVAERVTPAGDLDRNLTHLRKSLMGTPLADDQLHAMPNEALNREILDVAAGVSLFGFRELHILHVWDLWAEHLLRSRRAGRPSEDLDEMVRAERGSREEWLEDVVRDFRESLPSDQRMAVEPKLHLVKGPARDVIADG